MPTSGHEDEEIDKMYEQLEELIERQKGSDNVIIMGDWNAVVGEGKDGNEVGLYGLGQRNDRGDKLVEFCRNNKFVLTNTWFQQHKRRRYTWKKPGDIDEKRYQIDYILVRQRFRNSVKSSKSYPGADIDSDHNLVAMKVSVKLKRTVKGRSRQKWNMSQFKARATTFQQSIDDNKRNVEQDG